MIILEYFFFFLASLVSFYIPGIIFIRYFHIPLKPLEKHIAAWLVGLSLFTILSYLLAWLGVAQLILIVLAVTLVLYVRAFKSEKKELILLSKKIDKISLGIVLLGSCTFLFVMFFSGLLTSDGLQFFWVNARDGVQHVSSIKNMMYHFPPQRPDLAGETFRGYHYFHDFILSRFALYYRFQVEDLFFRFFPLLISLLYGGALFVFTSLFTDDKIKKRCILFFAYFAQSSTIFLWLFQKNVDLTNYASVQPLGLIVNPYNVLSIGMLFLGFVFIIRLKESWKYAVLVGLLLGVLMQFKVYTGVVALLAFLVFGVYELVRSKFQLREMINYALAGIIVLVLTIITYFPNNYGSGGLVFSPLTIYAHFLQKEQFASFHWEIKRTIFAEHHNVLRLIILYAQAIGIFWVINIGLRMVLFIKCKSIFSQLFWSNPANVLLLVAIIIPIGIGSLFIQTVSPLDIVQFFWLVFVLLSIPAGLAVGDICKGRKSVSTFCMIVILVALSMPSTIDFLTKNVSLENKLTVTKPILSIANQITGIVKPDEYIVYLPISKNNPLTTNTLIMSAITARSMYLEDGGIPGVDQTVYKSRRRAQDLLISSIEKCDRMAIKTQMEKIGSAYLLVTKPVPCLLAQDLATTISSIKDNLYFYQLK